MRSSRGGCSRCGCRWGCSGPRGRGGTRSATPLELGAAPPLSNSIVTTSVTREVAKVRRKSVDSGETKRASENGKRREGEQVEEFYGSHCARPSGWLDSSKNGWASERTGYKGTSGTGAQTVEERKRLRLRRAECEYFITLVT